MKYFAVFLPMKDEEKSKEFRTEHLEYLDEVEKKGNLFAKGRFVDGTGGLVIYKGESLEEVEALAKEDPYVVKGARDIEIREWDLILSN